MKIASDTSNGSRSATSLKFQTEYPKLFSKLLLVNKNGLEHLIENGKTFSLVYVK